MLITLVVLGAAVSSLQCKSGRPCPDARALNVYFVYSEILGFLIKNPVLFRFVLPPSGISRFFGTDKIFCFVDFHLGVPPKNWRCLVIWPKNDAKQEKKKEKKKENVGIVPMNSSFFLAREKRNHHDNLSFHLRISGTGSDSWSPHETKKF